jgi:hypothetical protein
MRARAAETGADAVIPDVVLHHDDDGAATQRVLAGVAGDRGVVLTGRAACRLSLDWSIPGNALWSARLVRQFGFEEFALNSDEYSVRRLFLACNKVAFCEGRFLYRQDNPNAITKRIDAGMFDWPLTQLRLAQLLQENGFDAALVRKEIDAAVAHMKRLAQSLDGLRTQWRTDQVARAEAAISLFEQRRTLKQVFDEPADPRREKGYRLRKWKASLRKLPRKLGLA